MRSCRKACLILGFVGFLSVPLSAQTMLRLEGEDAFILKELGAVLTTDADAKAARVLAVLPVEARPEGYRDIEIKKDDRILMVNAKRVKTAPALEAIYDGIETGGTVKLGIKRAAEMLMISFAKVDPSKLSAGVKVSVQGGPGSEGDPGGAMVMTRTMKLDTDRDYEEGIGPLFGTGLVVGGTAGAVEVAKIMSDPSGPLAGADIREGDRIASLNGEKIESLKHLLERYDALAAGQGITLVCLRDGVEVKTSFKKPKADGKVMVKTLPKGKDAN